MMGDRQSQKSGDSSLNIQGRDITLGLTYTQTRQVAWEVFEANFVRLRGEAAEIARERVESLLNSFLREAAKEGLGEIPEGKNPDFQYALYSAQKEYARSGNEDLTELFVQLLVDRTQVVDRTLVQIVLNESLEVAPKLMPGQLDVLSVAFMLKYSVFSELRSTADLRTSLNEFVLPFVTGASREASAYQHLEYAGCGAVSSGNLDAHAPFSRRYPGLLCEGFTEEELLEAVPLTPEQRSSLIVPCLHNATLLQVNALNDKQVDDLCTQIGVQSKGAEALKGIQRQKMMRPERIREWLIEICPQTKDLFDLWDNTYLSRLTLTSAGIAIAHPNVKRQTGRSFDLSVWIKD